MLDPYVRKHRGDGKPLRRKPAPPARLPGPRRAVFDDNGRLVAVIEGRDVTDQDVADCLRCLAMAPNNPSRGPIA